MRKSNEHNQRSCAHHGRAAQACADLGTDRPEQRETAGRRIAFRSFIARRGFTAASAARHAVMVSANAIHNFLNGHSRSLSQRTLEKFLAAFPDATADELFGRDVQGQMQIAPMNAATAQEGPGMIAVTTIIGAGKWQKAWHLPKDAQGVVPVPPTMVPPVKGVFGARVEGPGVELMYPFGSIVVCAPLARGHDRPASGRRVLVLRERGQQVEVTIREVVSIGDRTWLWSRSTAPDCQMPLLAPRRSTRQSASDGDVISITAIVLASWQPELAADPK
jgi:hypothetical protein